MTEYFDDDFAVQPKFINGKRQKGNGGVKKKGVKKQKKKDEKEIYNAKHVRIKLEKMEKSKSKN